MIRINLLGQHGGRASRGAARTSRLSGPTAWGGLMVVGALLLVGGHYVFLLEQGPSIQRQLNLANAENHRLQNVEKQVTALQATRADLDGRIAAIEQLGDKATGPSPLLTTLGNAVNGGPNLWLTNLEETGNELDVSGVASSLDRIADFMTSLQQSGEFADVKLDESTESPGQAARTPYSFKLGLTLGPPTVVVAAATVPKH